MKWTLLLLALLLSSCQSNEPTEPLQTYSWSDLETATRDELIAIAREYVAHYKGHPFVQKMSAANGLAVTSVETNGRVWRVQFHNQYRFVPAKGRYIYSIAVNLLSKTLTTEALGSGTMHKTRPFFRPTAESKRLLASLEGTAGEGEVLTLYQQPDSSHYTGALFSRGGMITLSVHKETLACSWGSGKSAIQTEKNLWREIK